MWSSRIGPYGRDPIEYVAPVSRLFFITVISLHLVVVGFTNHSRVIDTRFNCEVGSYRFQRPSASYRGKEGESFHLLSE